MRCYFMILFLLFTFVASAKTWTVGRGKNFISIKEAVNQVSAGDTILVYPGVYKEGQMIINKKIFIKGIDFPLLDGEKKFEIITIRANNVTIEGLYFKNSGRSSYIDVAALRIADSRYAVIRNNRFENTFFGIYSQHATACTITGNKLSSDAKDEITSANGIHCWKSDSMRITDNSVTGHRDGIYFEFVTNSIIRNNNSCQNVRYGLHFMFSSDNDFEINEFRNNGAGIAVMYSKNICMYSNIFADNWGTAAYGILMKDITDSEVQYNLFTKNTVGVMMEGSNRIVMTQNLFEGNGWAMKIQASCMDNFIAQNNFITNSFDVATNGELMLSKFENNYWDKYEGYDLNRNGTGDVPYHPVSLFSMIAERNPSNMMLYRSFIAGLLEKAEKMLPVITPVDLKDDAPLMKPIKYSFNDYCK
jgi:nitrous oxidase accessory protein